MFPNAVCEATVLVQNSISHRLRQRVSTGRTHDLEKSQSQVQAGAEIVLATRVQRLRPLG
jgi:hypothetical protein